MLGLRDWLVPAVAITCLLGVSPANAQSAGCYTLASLQGSWAVVGNYGANVGIALGERYVDANGNLSATFIVNGPTAGSTTGERTITTGTNAGTYAVNCDGTGTITRLLTASNGVVANQVDDFLITQAILQGGQLIATEIADAVRVPSALVPGGIFLTRVHTRLPNAAGCYTLASLQGSYGVGVTYGANLALGLQPESLDGKGNLNRTGINNQPTTGSATGERTITKVTSTGTYTVNCDGTGTITRTVTRADGTTAPAVDDFIITQASVQNGQLIAAAIVDAQRGPALVGPTATLVTRTHTLRATLAAPPGGTPASGTTAAVANPKNAVTTNFQIQLDGTVSTSADGKPLAYSWTQPASSPAATIIGGNTAAPLVQFTSGPGAYTFTLTVTDSAGKTATDSTTVTALSRSRG